MDWTGFYMVTTSVMKGLKGLCTIDYINIPPKVVYYTVSSLETTKKPIEKESFDVKGEKSVLFMN